MILAPLRRGFSFEPGCLSNWRGKSPPHACGDGRNGTLPSTFSPAPFWRGFCYPCAGRATQIALAVLRRFLARRVVLQKYGAPRPCCAGGAFLRLCRTYVRVEGRFSPPMAQAMGQSATESPDCLGPASPAGLSFSAVTQSSSSAVIMTNVAPFGPALPRRGFSFEPSRRSVSPGRLDPGDGALNFILERLDAGLSTNAKPRRKP